LPMRTSQLRGIPCAERLGRRTLSQRALGEVAAYAISTLQGGRVARV
jgi:hypothetical protein